VGKAEALWQETVKSTTRAAWVGGLTSYRRIHRDNDGKILLPAGMATTIKTRLIGYNRKKDERMIGA